MNSENKAKALNELNRQWSKKELPLMSAATNVVPGEGNPDADVMFIGEGPGRDEDLQGRPFVGAAGKFLNELIAMIGWQREDVYIANIIKHRAPGNRDPLPQEIEVYAPWLDQQVAIIQPKLIATLGRYSLEHFLGPGLPISKIHGQPKRRGRQVVLPMYHPAAALYRGNLREVLIEDFKKIPKVLEMVEKDAESISTTNETPQQTQDKQAEQQKTLL
jgi:uracil-DNA glycosylase